MTLRARAECYSLNIKSPLNIHGLRAGAPEQQCWEVEADHECTTPWMSSWMSVLLRKGPAGEVRSLEHAFGGWILSFTPSSFTYSLAASGCHKVSFPMSCPALIFLPWQRTKAVVLNKNVWKTLKSWVRINLSSFTLLCSGISSQWRKADYHRNLVTCIDFSIIDS